MTNDKDGRIIIAAYIGTFLFGIAFWAALVIGLLWLVAWVQLPPVLR